MLMMKNAVLKFSVRVIMTSTTHNWFTEPTVRYTPNLSQMASRWQRDKLFTNLTQALKVTDETTHNIVNKQFVVVIVAICKPSLSLFYAHSLKALIPGWRERDGTVDVFISTRDQRKQHARSVRGVFLAQTYKLEVGRYLHAAFDVLCFWLLAPNCVYVSLILRITLGMMSRL